MKNLIIFNKPFNVLTQFSDDGSGKSNLSDYLSGEECQNFYPAGRLDYDSEGLLLLTNDGQLQHRIASPEHKLAKVYWAQVEGIPDRAQLKALCAGVTLKDGLTRPAKARLIAEPDLWTRHPPIRKRLNIPTSWIELTLTEGKNRQVRRMTAAVNLPTLRLIRWSIGQWNIHNLKPGEYQFTTANLPLRTANRETSLRTRKQTPTKRIKKR